MYLFICTEWKVPLQIVYFPLLYEITYRSAYHFPLLSPQETHHPASLPASGVSSSGCRWMVGPEGSLPIPEGWLGLSQTGAKRWAKTCLLWLNSLSYYLK